MKKLIFVIFDVQASKWVQNDPQAYKQLQILKAQAFSFPKIYNTSFHFILFYVILFYVILFYLFYFILFIFVVFIWGGGSPPANRYR